MNKRRKLLVNQAKNGTKNQTVFAGDSITEIYPLENMYSDYTATTGQKVYNSGISGQTSCELLDRFDSTVLELKPKTLILLVGTNDIGSGIPADKICRNITAMIEKTQKICPNARIILETVYPINEHMDKKQDMQMVGTRTNKAVKELNKLLKDTAKSHNIEFLDLTDILSDENGDFNREYTYDGLHPSEKGFEVITKEIKNCLFAE